MTEHPIFDVEPLRSAIGGEVVVPGDAGWDSARQAWNLVADQRPAIVVLASSPEDVTETIRFAREHGLRVAPQSTGHGAPSLGDLAGHDPAAHGRAERRDDRPGHAPAQVQAGAVWAAVVEAAAPHGLVALHGFSAGVGVAGYMLGGGIGWLVRSHGFASSHVRSFDVVTAVGNRLHVDEEREPDLYWALRGGGGGPVVVTSIELELFPLPEAFGGSLLWPLAQATRDRARLSRVGRERPGHPDLDGAGSYASLRSRSCPSRCGARSFARSRSRSRAASVEGNGLVAPLRAIAPPYLDTLALQPPARSAASPATRRARSRASETPSWWSRSRQRWPTRSSSSAARTCRSR